MDKTLIISWNSFTYIRRNAHLGSRDASACILVTFESGRVPETPPTLLTDVSLQCGFADDAADVMTDWIPCHTRHNSIASLLCGYAYASSDVMTHWNPFHTDYRSGAFLQCGYADELSDLMTDWSACHTHCKSRIFPQCGYADDASNVINSWTFSHTGQKGRVCLHVGWEDQAALQKNLPQPPHEVCLGCSGFKEKEERDRVTTI